MAKSISYKDAGVNIDEADRALDEIRRMARATFTKGVLTDIGSFGGCFALPKMRRPVLVSSVDGVGTKLKIAFATGRHSTIGEDLVNHCVNDIAVQGAKPLFFLDYLAVGKLEASVAAQVVSGIARGCKAALTVAGGYVIALNVANAAEEEGEGDIGPTEDLMREHGVLRRVLLIYEEGLRRIAAHQDIPGNPFLTGAM